MSIYFWLMPRFFRPVYFDFFPLRPVMHGLIHVVFRDFVVDTFGTEAWQQILAKAGIEDASTILEMKHYDDALTFAAVKIGAEVAGAPLDVALELFGKYFVDFAARSGFVKLLQSLGSNLHEFLGNLNILHHNVERDLPAAHLSTLRGR